MKKLVTALCICAFLASCGSEKSEYEHYYEDKDGQTAQTETDPSADIATEDNMAAAEEPAEPVVESEYAKGAKLIAGSDCLSCHQEEKKVVGPSYVDVANKYEMNDKNIDYLAGKIIEGGKGVWGEIPMIAHPDMSRDDAKEMAKYILSLKK